MSLGYDLFDGLSLLLEWSEGLWMSHRHQAGEPGSVGLWEMGLRGDTKAVFSPASLPLDARPGDRDVERAMASTLAWLLAESGALEAFESPVRQVQQAPAFLDAGAAEIPGALVSPVPVLSMSPPHQTIRTWSDDGGLLCALCEDVDSWSVLTDGRMRALLSKDSPQLDQIAQAVASVLASECVLESFRARGVQERFR